MKNRFRLVFVAMAAVQTAQAAPAASDDARRPTRPWILDYAPTHCTASRAYGTDEQPMTIAFRPSPTTNVMKLMVVRHGRNSDPYHFPVRTSLAPASSEASALRFSSADKKLTVVWINVTNPDLARLRKSLLVEIKGGRDISETFAVPGIGGVIDALAKCRDDLRAYWNLTDEMVAKISKAPEPKKPLYEYFSDADFPRQAHEERKSGTVEVLLMIDETGALTDCSVNETSGIASFDAMTCGALLERAKFRPALDTAGKPIRSVLSTRVLFRMAD